MCGIIGYIGKRQAFPVLLSGLLKLEYRGYDSFGFAILQKNKEPFYYKKSGKISQAQESLNNMDVKGTLGIAHTRWATTGEVSDRNAHPQSDCSQNIFVVHNGIIENYKELKQKLIKEGHKFFSETDTEVIAHLIEENFLDNLEDAVRKALKEIKGTYGLAVVSQRDPDKIVVARVSSPLLIGIGNGEYIVSSDPLAIVAYTKKVVTLDDYEIATIDSEGLKTVKEKKEQILEIDANDVEKGNYKHFMLKEIEEEPEAVRNAVRGRLLPKQGNVKLGGLEDVKDRLSEIEKFYILGCGTSYYASLLGEYLFEEIGGVQTKGDFASEFRYKKTRYDPKKTAGIFISQSGETADTLGALNELKARGCLSVGITNVVGSTQARETDAGIYFHSGPEIAVASTKAFLGQISSLLMVAVFLGRQRNLTSLEAQEILEEFKNIPDLMQQVLKEEDNIKNIVNEYKKHDNFFFLGRKYDYPIAMEGALKLKEITYLHAEGLAGGEIKHGPLSLVDRNFPVIALCPKSSVYEKMIANLEEISTRGGKILAIATKGDKKIEKIADHVIYIPKTLEILNPFLSIIPLHLFAYYMALALGREVDKPRNLAKSVTVE